MSVNKRYKIIITPAAELKYIKKLRKRHKSHWAMTFMALKKMTERIDGLLLTDKARLLNAVNGHKLIKIYFTIAGSNKSAKNSGHRCIIYIDEQTQEIQILLVYSKNEIGKHHENAKIKEHLKKDHAEMSKLFNL